MQSQLQAEKAEGEFSDFAHWDLLVLWNLVLNGGLVVCYLVLSIFWCLLFFGCLVLRLNPEPRTQNPEL